MQQQIYKLSNGARLSYCRFGLRGGAPAFYFHGLPGSRLEGELLDASCKKYGLELFAPDRFGFGGTTPQQQDRYRLWAAAIDEFAAHLGIKRFYLIAASGGAPYALACASLLAPHVIATGICCGLGSLATPELRKSMSSYARGAIFLAKHSPTLLKLSYGMILNIVAHYFSTQAITVLGMINGKADREALAEPKIHQILARDIAGAFSQGSCGGVEDLIAANQAWPFELNHIQNIQLWHGDQDRVVPLIHSAWLQRQIPAARLHIRSGEGHFSLPIRYNDE
ncbi:MAG: alpha/beta hydrolase, partial [Thioalkalispiraceae bacterium]